jgi:hypothetical protein
VRRRRNPLDPSLRDLERAAATGDPRALAKLAVARLRSGERLRIRTEPLESERPSRTRDDYVTLFSVKDFVVAWAIWAHHPQGWPSPETVVTEISVDREFERAFDWEDLAMDAVGKAFPAATQYPFQGKIKVV